MIATKSREEFAQLGLDQQILELKALLTQLKTQAPSHEGHLTALEQFLGSGHTHIDSIFVSNLYATYQEIAIMFEKMIIDEFVAVARISVAHIDQTLAPEQQTAAQKALSGMMESGNGLTGAMGNVTGATTGAMNDPGKTVKDVFSGLSNLLGGFGNSKPTQPIAQPVTNPIATAKQNAKNTLKQHIAELRDVPQRPDILSNQQTKTWLANTLQQHGAKINDLIVVANAEGDPTLQQIQQAQATNDFFRDTFAQGQIDISGIHDHITSQLAVLSNPVVQAQAPANPAPANPTPAQAPMPTPAPENQSLDTMTSAPVTTNQ